MQISHLVKKKHYNQMLYALKQQCHPKAIKDTSMLRYNESAMVVQHTHYNNNFHIDNFNIKILG